MLGTSLWSSRYTSLASEAVWALHRYVAGTPPEGRAHSACTCGRHPAYPLAHTRSLLSSIAPQPRAHRRSVGRQYSRGGAGCRSACNLTSRDCGQQARGRAAAGWGPAWSCMREMRGDTTTVTPAAITAGSWKHSDFPPAPHRSSRPQREWPRIPHPERPADSSPAHVHTC